MVVVRHYVGSRLNPDPQQEGYLLTTAEPSLQPWDHIFIIYSVVLVNLYLFIMCIGVYVHMCASAQGGQKRVSESLELEFQAVVNYQKWVLKLKPGSSARGTKGS